jgi:ribosomal protein S18
MTEQFPHFETKKNSMTEQLPFSEKIQPKLKPKLKPKSTPKTLPEPKPKPRSKSELKPTRKLKSNPDITKRKKAVAIELRKTNIQNQLNPPPVRPFIGVPKQTPEEKEKQKEKERQKKQIETGKRLSRRKYRWIRRGVSHRRRYDPRYRRWRRLRYEKKHNKKKKPRKIPMVLAKQGVHGKINRTILDYKNLFLLRQYLSIQGKIKPRKKTQLTAKKQRKMSTTIKTARMMGLLPFIRR